MKKDKLKSLLITITGELKKLSKEELLTEAACAKGFSGIMKDANLLTSNETPYEYLCGKTTFGSFDNYIQQTFDLYSVGSGNIAADNYDYAMAA
jgi:hypothetical protein